MFPKSRRIVNKKLLKEIRDNYTCLICGAPNPDPHHFTGRKAGGDDTLNNLIPLCRIHHSEIHLTGKLSFAKKHKVFQSWINERISKKKRS